MNRALKAPTVCLGCCILSTPGTPSFAQAATPTRHPSQYRPPLLPSGGYRVLMLHRAGADATVGLPEPHRVVVACSGQDHRVTAHCAGGRVHGAEEGSGLHRTPLLKGRGQRSEHLQKRGVCGI